jgi:hypothetical protein
MPQRKTRMTCVLGMPRSPATHFGLTCDRENAVTYATHAATKGVEQSANGSRLAVHSDSRRPPGQPRFSLPMVPICGL